MPSSRSRIAFLAFILASQVFLYGVRWWKADVTTSDFVYFYVVGRLYSSGENPYDLKKQCDAQSLLRYGECAGYAHTPILLPLLGFLFNDDFIASYWRWAIFQLLLLALCVWLLFRLSNDIFASLQCALFPPIIGALLIGNDTVFMLTALLSWAVLLLDKKDLWAGVCLAFMILKPQLALPLAIPMLFVRPKAFIGFCVGGFVLTLYSLAIVGLQGFHGIVEVMRGLSQESTFGGVSQSIMFNATGLLARAGISSLWAWPIYVAAIVGLCVYLKKKGITLGTLSMIVLITVVSCPHLFFYDLSYLVVPMVYVHPLAPAVGAIITGLASIGLPWWTIYLAMLVLVVCVSRLQRAERCGQIPAA